METVVTVRGNDLKSVLKVIKKIRKEFDVVEQSGPFNEIDGIRAELILSNNL